MRRLFLVMSAVWLMLLAPLLATGTVTIETRSNPEGVFTYTVAWTSTAGGVVDGNAFRTIQGRVIQVRAVPSAGGTQPTDSYDVTVLDPAGVDLLDAAGADQSNAVGEYFLMNPSIMLTTQNLLDVVIANAGNAKSGTVTVWVQR